MDGRDEPSQDETVNLLFASENEEIPMKLPLTGTCQCGNIRYEIIKSLQLVYACHCTDCQRITSSASSLGSPCRRRPFV